jgi:hypothetical protein
MSEENHEGADCSDWEIDVKACSIVRILFLCIVEVRGRR